MESAGISTWHHQPACLSPLFLLSLYQVAPSLSAASSARQWACLQLLNIFVYLCIAEISSTMTWQSCRPTSSTRYRCSRFCKCPWQETMYSAPSLFFLLLSSFDMMCWVTAPSLPADAETTWEKCVHVAPSAAALAYCLAPLLRGWISMNQSSHWNLEFESRFLTVAWCCCFQAVLGLSAQQPPELLIVAIRYYPAEAWTKTTWQSCRLVSSTLWIHWISCTCCLLIFTSIMLKHIWFMISFCLLVFFWANVVDWSRLSKNIYIYICIYKQCALYTLAWS